MFYVIWRRPNNTYYYKFVKGTYKKYYVGYFNQYDHEVVLIIQPIIKSGNFFKRLLLNIIRRLLRLYKKL